MCVYMFRYLLLLILIHSTASGEIRLSLQEAVQLAISRSPEVVAERATWDATNPAVTTAKGAFDPIFGLRGDWRRSRTPAPSILQGANGRLDETWWTQTAEVRQRLPWLGIRWESALESQRVATSNPFTSLNPYYQLVQRNAITLPLWRFRSTDEARTELKVRRREQLTGQQEFAARLVDLTHRVETAYWNLVSTTQALEAARAIEQAARESLDSTTRLVREGDTADADLAGARGQFNRAAENRANAEGARGEAEAALKAFLTSSPNDPLWSDGLLAVEQESKQADTSLNELTRRALEGHPELLALQFRLESQRAQTELAASAAAPQVDLQFSHQRQGLAGRAVPQESFFPGLSLDAPPQLLGGFARAGSQTLRNRYPAYQITLNIELPIRNRAAEGRLAQQRIFEKRLRALRSQAEVQLTSGIQQAWSRWEAARVRIDSAQSALLNSEQRYASELRLFREGQSNNLNLNTRQNELAESRQLLVNAWRGFNQAAADLRRVSGANLKHFAIEVE